MDTEWQVPYIARFTRAQKDSAGFVNTCAPSVLLRGVIDGVMAAVEVVEVFAELFVVHFGVLGPAQASGIRGLRQGLT